MTRRQAERLTDLQIKQTKPHSDKATILPDGKGLRLVVYPNDARYWQLRSARDGKERTIQLGIYPQMSLAKARKEAERVRETLAAGRDPVTERVVAKAKLHAATGNTFEAVATAMLDAKGKNVSISYLEKLRGAFKSNLYPRIGKMPIQEITSPVLREALRRIEARGSLDMLANVRRWSGEVFDFAKANDQFTGDNPAHALIKNIFESHSRARMKALPWDEMPAFMRSLDEKRGAEITTLAAIRLPALSMGRLAFLGVGSTKSPWVKKLAKWPSNYREEKGSNYVDFSVRQFFEHRRQGRQIGENRLGSRPAKG